MNTYLPDGGGGEGGLNRRQQEPNVGETDDYFGDYVLMQTGLVNSDSTHKGAGVGGGDSCVGGYNGVLPSTEPPALHDGRGVCASDRASLLATQGADTVCSGDWIGEIGEERGVVNGGGINMINGGGGVTPPMTCPESSSLHINGNISNSHLVSDSNYSHPGSNGNGGHPDSNGTHPGSEMLSKSSAKTVLDRDSWGHGSCGQASELGNSWEQSSDSPTSELCPLYEDSTSDDNFDSDYFPMEGRSASFSSPMPSCRSASFSNITSSCHSRSSRSASFSSPVPASSYHSTPYGSATCSNPMPSCRVSVYSLSSAFALLDKKGRCGA